MKTLAQLKRDAKSGKLFAEMIIFHGLNNIPERLQGERQVIDSNSVGIKFLNSDGKKSELRIESANLIEYTDENITVYKKGERELTEQEKAIFDKWETLRDKKQEEIDLLSDGSTTFYRHKHFFIDSGYEYLLGYEIKQGKKYNMSTGKVMDNSIKGEIEWQYKIVS